MSEIIWLEEIVLSSIGISSTNRVSLLHHSTTEAAAWAMLEKSVRVKVVVPGSSTTRLAEITISKKQHIIDLSMTKSKSSSYKLLAN